VKPLHNRIDDARKALKCPWEILEKDYVLSWLIAGIGKDPILCDRLVFKGGTALRKCYFGDYRFSEDLDFSATPDCPRGDELEAGIVKSCATAKSLVHEFAPIEISCRRYVERDEHPAGQEAFEVHVKFEWQRTALTRLLVEIIHDEKVLKPALERPIIHGYGETLDARIKVYALEEIVAEKLRALLQHTEILRRRGWDRSRARDYYDVWRILGAYGDTLDFAGFPGFLQEKCAVRNVSFKSAEDFFDVGMIANVEKTWKSWLGPLVPDLPEFHGVIADLKNRLALFLPPSQ
jgi:predicted nucleotidyltransferase component of viral defense system